MFLFIAYILLILSTIISIFVLGEINFGSNSYKNDPVRFDSVNYPPIAEYEVQGSCELVLMNHVYDL